MTAYWTTLSHNGVCFPDPYQPGGLSVRVTGREVALSALAEEMAYNLAKKKDTPYIKDPVFDSNFMSDFVRELPSWCRKAKFEDVDFSSLFRKVDREKAAKESMRKEERKDQAAGRKARREALKEQYGYAILDGKKVEFGNYMVEPPGLFMGRGRHPLRGRWKPRVTERDVILNLDEGAQVPGEWKEVVHDHDSMWMAKWVDKLTKKEKYVWLHESTPIQQSRSRAKYDNALKVDGNLEKIRARVLRNLSSKELKERQVAAICYLIDQLGMRVGDEKDEDEADTVGATTLRVEHINFDGDVVEFKFLGKDSVQWHKRLEHAPPALLGGLREFMADKKADEALFHEVDSGMVNRFFSEIVPGVTAKVFRTHHATKVAEEALRSRDVAGDDDLTKLFHAKHANLEAARFCNHQRTIPKNWEESLAKKREKLKEVQSRESVDPKRVKKLKIEIDFQVKAKNYNLNTSLKNYIDPRLYKAWCDYVGLEWAKIYTASMQRKFSWVERYSKKWEPEKAIQVVAKSG